jgi:hypothetical protein
MPESRLIAGRYRIARPLGRGGNAQVYEVVDEAKDIRVALKCLTKDDAGRRHRRESFEREYNTLSELAHPLIVRVFDYGVDGTPYYTMELLEGIALRGRIPWREACAILRDVASALSLLHSRRLVHRDVTHRNVHRKQDGRAVLLDFGALVPMGPTKDVVGTPPFMPPEAIAEQRLDARSDLFSLGALGYLMLTEQHAFPASSVAALGEVWKRPVAPPSLLSSDVPKALDELIVSLLSLNAVGRPSSAAEVWSRLTAIASLPATDAPGVARAYLTTPALVGRSDAARAFKHELAQTRRSRAKPLVIDCEGGLGRSRLLSSLVLEAKLEGFYAMRVDAVSAGAEPCGAGIALARRLFDLDPTLTRDAAGSHAETLGPLVFAERTSTPPRKARTASVIDAFCALFLAASDRWPIVLGVDDFERLDAASQQLVVRLSGLSRHRQLLVLVALRRDVVIEAQALLRQETTALPMFPLSGPEMRELVRSLFGDVENVDAVARWVRDISAGRPRAAMEAANHLVESGVIRFEDGLWLLPQRLPGTGLPASVDQALDATIAALDRDARELCRALSLSSEQDPLLVAEYGDLVPGVSGARLDAALRELVARSIIVPTSQSFAFAHPGLREAARRSVPLKHLPDVHRRIAQAYGSAEEPSFALSAHHSLAAGDLELAFEQATLAVQRRTAFGVRGEAFLRTKEGERSLEVLFEWGLAAEKPWRDVLALGLLLVQQAAVADMSLVRHKDPVLARLCLDSGLSDYEALLHVEDPGERILAALARAQARHDTTPEARRGVSPREAIEGLYNVVPALAGVFGRRNEPAEVEKLAPLVEPFRPLSPAAALVCDFIPYCVDAVLVRDVAAVRLRLLETLASPIPDLSEVSRKGMYWLTLFYHALEEAAAGRPGASQRVEPLFENAVYAPLAWEVRMVAALFQGDMDGAEAARRQRDLSNLACALEVAPQLDAARLYEISAYDFGGDLVRLKSLLGWLEQSARECPGLEGYYHLQVGNYHRLRGELAKSLVAYQRAIERAPRASAHGEFTYVAMRLGQALVECGRAGEARELCARAVSESIEHRSVKRLQLCLEMILAIAEAATGDSHDAVERSERLIREATDDRIEGVIFVTLCKDQGRVAELTGDDELLERVLARLEAYAENSKHSAFATKTAHLLRQTQARGRLQVAPNPHVALSTTTTTHTSELVDLRSELELCRGRGERAQKALRILLDMAASDEGFLYLCGEDTVQLAAASGVAAPTQSLEALVFERLRSGTAEGDTTGEGHDSVRMRSLRPAALESHFDVVEVITQRGGRCRLAALAALRPRKGSLDPIPLFVREALSEAFIAAGDTAGIPWA